jgi:hypothetical protein
MVLVSASLLPSSGSMGSCDGMFCRLIPALHRKESRAHNTVIIKSPPLQIALESLVELPEPNPKKKRNLQAV